MAPDTSKMMAGPPSLKPIKHSVTQGSVLGPLLFLLFINDLPQVKQNAEVVIFAHDANILITGKNILSLNEKIQNVQNQFKK
jgi:hypothetical protein